MKFQIGNYTIERADENNITVTVQRIGKAKDSGEEKEVNARLGYYGSLESALIKVLNHSVEESDAMTAGEVMAVIERAKGEILEAVRGMK